MPIHIGTISDSPSILGMCNCDVAIDNTEEWTLDRVFWCRLDREYYRVVA